MNYKQLVQELAQIRKDLRLCSRALSDRIGVAESSVSLWECGKKVPNAQLLMDWCTALGTTLTMLHGKTTISIEYPGSIGGIYEPFIISQGYLKCSCKLS